MDIESEVIGLIAEITRIPAERIGLEATMDDFQEWDSMRHLMLLSELEQHFGLMFPEDDIFDLVSVQALIDEVKKLKGP